MDIDEEMLRVLRGRAPQDRALTISDFARSFGANPKIIVTAARRLVDHDLAKPFLVDVRGVPTLHGLLPLPRPGAVTSEP